MGRSRNETMSSMHVLISASNVLVYYVNRRGGLKKTWGFKKALYFQRTKFQ